MAKKKVKKETPVLLNITFEEAVKKALSTPLQNKITKKGRKKIN
jgi:hypothetical protein